jgi:hypothetical protein
MAKATKVVKRDVKWAQMSAIERLAFIGKTCVFFMTAGFVFPTLLD